MNPRFKFTAVLGLLAAVAVGLFGPFTPDLNAAAGLAIAAGVSISCAPDFGSLRMFAVPHGGQAGPITLLDLAMRSGENVAAVVEEVVTVAPELGVFPAVPIDGTSYDVLRRVGLPAGGFRPVGSGVAMSKSKWEREVKPMYLFEAQMLIGQDIVLAQTKRSRSTVGDVLADEAMSTVKGSIINLGQQCYYGVKADASGFAGLSTLWADEINAGGTTNSTSVYLGWLDPSETNPQGIHLALGLGGSMDFGEWSTQQVDMGGGKKTTAWVNGMMFYIGLATASEKSCWRIRGVNAANPWTDELGATLLEKVPLARRQNLRWFANATAMFTLQKARTNAQINQGLGSNFAPWPVDCQNIPIVPTDSLLNTETSGTI